MNIKNKILIAVLLLTVIIPFFALSLYNQPSADDFCYWNSAKKFGYIDAQIKLYNNWTGRYTASAILFIQKLEYFYMIIPILLLLTLLSVIYWLYRITFDDKNYFDPLLISLSVLSLFLYRMPSTAEGIYWLSGSMTHTLGAVSFLSLLCFFIRPNNKKNNVFLISVLIVITIGFNESIMLLLSGIIVFLFVYKFLKKDNKKYLYFVFLLLAIVSSAIVILSKGNLSRMGVFIGKDVTALHIFWTYSNLFKYFFVKWIFNIPFALISFFGIIFFTKKNVIYYQKPMLSFGLAFMVPTIMLFPVIYSTGSTPGYRVINIAYLLFLILWMYSLSNLSHYIKNKKIDLKFLSKYSAIIIFVAVGFSVLDYEGNIYHAYDDIFSNRAYDYKIESENRNDVINKAELTKLKNRPKTIFYSDYMDGINGCYYDYKQLK